ncbi:MAG: hypothetical protein GF330_07270 [Candidatus Eisenbacteria bacterium]|nr:hypothetical protein [Candidatus Eisenbacteria bacterium]
MSKKSILILSLALIGLGGLLGASWLTPRGSAPACATLAHADPPASNAAGEIVLAINVGSVLTRDGTLWVYRPDLEKWLTIDEAFRQEGRETHLMPLPVPVDQIRDMATYGFIVTETDQLWLYEHATDKWRQLPTPRR